MSRYVAWLGGQLASLTLDGCGGVTTGGLARAIPSLYQLKALAVGGAGAGMAATDGMLARLAACPLSGRLASNI